MSLIFLLELFLNNSGAFFFGWMLPKKKQQIIILFYIFVKIYDNKKFHFL